MRKLWELACVFFKLGLFAFGGSAAYIAMMHKEIVRDKKWMDDKSFMDLYGWTALIPGANSTQMAIQCGYQREKTWGYIVSGLAFVIPTSVVTLLLAWGYVEFAGRQIFESLFLGFRAVVLGIIISVLFSLGKSSLKNWKLAAICLMIFITVRIGVSPVASIIFAGLLGMLWFSVLNKYSLGGIAPFLGLQIGARVICSIKAVSSTSIFLNFVKMGLVVFGSEYVLVGHLQELVVRQLGWITQAELYDAVALSQFVPGPVISLAGFIGFQTSGLGGGLLAIVGVFIPSFVMVALFNYLRPKISDKKAFQDFMSAVNVGVVAVMAVVVLQMCKWTLQDWRTTVISLLGIFLVFVFKKLSVVWIVVVGGILGSILYLI